MTKTESDHPATLTRYFGAMDSGDFDVALSCFAEDATYIRMAISPPAPPGTTGLIEIQGRDAIAEFFVVRGKRPTEHRIFVAQQIGDHAWLEGRSTAGDNPSRSFLCHAEFDKEGLIIRFLALAG
jgi:hypothetical protein